ncbi:MAG: SDR family oxidoreductase, partial [Bacteroidetes bacterium]|nr:SDR family oxidoreductase [Bacteroidota bacterium]
SLYGAAGQDRVTEEADFNPVTPYGTAKVLAERDIRPLASESFSPIFMRNGTVYGISPRLRFDLVVNNLTAWAVATGQVRMKSDGTPWRPLVHVEDVCTAFLTALEAPREAIHNEAFNVGSTSENYQVRDVATIVGEVVPDCAVSFADGASPDSRSYRVAFEKITERLGWSPKWTVRDGAEQVYEVLRGLKLAPEVFEGERYSRIEHLKVLLADGRVSPDLRWRSESDVSD